MLEKTRIVAEKIPTLHPQWNALDFVDILSLPTAWLSIGQSNSILSSFGAQSSEGVWERARRPGGSIGNTLKLASTCRDVGVRSHLVSLRDISGWLPRNRDGSGPMVTLDSGQKLECRRTRARRRPH